MAAIISSVAFPKVALRSPPMAGPLVIAISSVALPSNPARGIMAIAAIKKIATPPPI
jgi:hypothetical protein